jgi:hypothetical protein
VAEPPDSSRPVPFGGQSVLGMETSTQLQVIDQSQLTSKLFAMSSNTKSYSSFCSSGTIKSSLYS